MTSRAAFVGSTSLIATPVRQTETLSLPSITEQVSSKFHAGALTCFPPGWDFIVVLLGPAAGRTALGLRWSLGKGPDTCCQCSWHWDCRISITFQSLSLQLVAVDHDLFERWPQLAAWRERVEAFLGTDLCQEAHGVVLNILEQAANKMLPDPPSEMQLSMLSRISRIP